MQEILKLHLASAKTKKFWCEMFHVGIGVKCAEESDRGEDLRMSIYRWESKFTSDPLVFRSSGSEATVHTRVPFPTKLCEVKLFRDFAGLLEGVPFDILPAQRGCRILMLGFPTGLDLEEFVTTSMEGVKYYSELPRSHGGDFDRSALFVFRSQSEADKFFRDWHIQFFNVEVTEGPVCYLTFIDKVYIAPADSATFQSLLPMGSQQIPSCPLCIERIDVNVSGVITSRRGWLSSGSYFSESCVACSHLFHPSLSCSSCEPAESGVWLCLLCGHVGCGRYAKGHAEAHSRLSRHRLSLEMATGRIWDYAGDLFVHRRIVSQASVLDLPERIDANSLPVHPQVSFEEDIRELNKTMTDQLAHERTKYEEACTQLRILGQSRLHTDEDLLRRDKQQEHEMADRLKKSFTEKELLSASLRQIQIRIRDKESRLQQLNRDCKELTDRLTAITAKGEMKISKNKTDELTRLEVEVERLRLLVSGLS